jgi:hypothetical protein
LAFRRPSVYRSNDFVFQDFLHSEANGFSFRYILAKYDGYTFTSLGETSDYSAPNLEAGHVISRLDYTLSEKLVVIDHWEVYWRDDWPLRLIAQYMRNCLYPSRQGYSVRVNKDAYPFWVSENFLPQTNHPQDMLSAG